MRLEKIAPLGLVLVVLTTALIALAVCGSCSRGAATRACVEVAYPTYAKANITGLWVDWWYSEIYFEADGEITYYELRRWAPYQYYYYEVQHAPPFLPKWSIGATAITYLGRVSSDTIDAYAWTVDFHGTCPV